MTPFDLYRQNATIEPIDRRIFNTQRRESIKSVLLAVAIGTGLALALVSWWSA